MVELLLLLLQKFVRSQQRRNATFFMTANMVVSLSTACMKVHFKRRVGWVSELHELSVRCCIHAAKGHNVGGLAFDDGKL